MDPKLLNINIYILDWLQKFNWTELVPLNLKLAYDQIHKDYELWLFLTIYLCLISFNTLIIITVKVASNPINMIREWEFAK